MDATKIEELDRLIATALAEADDTKRNDALSKAVVLICQMLLELRRELPKATKSVLQQLRVSQTKPPLSFRDLAEKTPSLGIFRSEQAYDQFLKQVEPLLALKGLPPQRVEDVFAIMRGRYDSIVDQPADVQRLGAEVERLRRFFCRPPDKRGGGGGPINDGGGPKGGPSESRLSRVASWAGIFGFIFSVYQYAQPTPPPPKPPPEPPPITTTNMLRLLLLAILGVGMLADDIEEEVGIPHEETKGDDVRVSNSAATLEEADREYAGEEEERPRERYAGEDDEMMA